MQIDIIELPSQTEYFLVLLKLMHLTVTYKNVLKILMSSTPKYINKEWRMGIKLPHRTHPYQIEDFSPVYTSLVIEAPRATNPHLNDRCLAKLLNIIGNCR